MSPFFFDILIGNTSYWIIFVFNMNIGGGMRLKMIPPEQLVPNRKNPRIHDDEHVRQIADSIIEFGFRSPVLIDDDGNIIAGHGRVLAAKTVGIQKIPCIFCSDMSDSQKNAYMIADNKIAINSSWDEDLLKELMVDLSSLEMDMSCLGFSDRELAILLRDSIERESENDIPEIPDQIVTNEGDVWIMGRHRLMCGNANCGKDVSQLFGGESPGIMVTDPPYGVNYSPDWRNRYINRGKDSERTGTVINDDQNDWSKALSLFRGDVCYMWCPNLHIDIFMGSLKECNFQTRNVLIWNKNRFAISRGHYHWKHEPCLYSVRKGKKSSWIGGRDQSTVWDMDVPIFDGNNIHSTQKPVEAMRRPMQNHSIELVYDPFVGSGTSIIAAETCGKTCYAMEINPQYVDIAIIRFQDIAKVPAILEKSGKEFNDIKRGGT